ncbi:MAG: nucleotidyl transferase AbiEii/AbiGii toxin family protein [Acidobacteria bacterium]|nr:nucleotidyl transferase AbiEii/AbiGii toxin family protein [Acidobacteriota bacterium]
MDFGQNLEDLRTFLDGRQRRWALIGGVALAAYGFARTTLDLDLVVDADAQEEIVRFMEELGFKTLYCSTAYSNHLHADPVRGRVDFLYVRVPTSDRLFAEAEERKGPRGIPVRVPKPEHLIAMKVLAIKGDPSRTFQDLADIRFLASLPGVRHDQIRRQFERHGLLDRYRDLERTL